MITQKQILSNCFSSQSKLWTDFLQTKGDLNILFYPSAGEDLKPLIYSKDDFLRKESRLRGAQNRLTFTENNYLEPNFYIFSDYFPFPDSNFFDNRKLFHEDDFGSIEVLDLCEIFPKPESFIYQINSDYTPLNFSPATGRAIFFKAKVTSPFFDEPYFSYGIYFFYENVNLIDQLILRNNLHFTHVVWKRDGTGLGGGTVSHDFLFPLASIRGTKYFFVWNMYMDDERLHVTNQTVSVTNFPVEIKSKLEFDFSLPLKKIYRFCNDRPVFHWETPDFINLYTEDKRSIMPHDSWSKYYDFVYEKSFGSFYQTFTNISLSVIEDMLPIGTILDFGAGTGRLSIPLAQNGYHVIAIEQSQKMASLLQEKRDRLNLPFEIFNCGISDFNNGKGNLAMAVFTVLSYITNEDDLYNSFENISKHLKVGCYFFFDLPNPKFFSMGKVINVIEVDFTRVAEVTPSGQDEIFTYTEACRGNFNGEEFSYKDSFPIRQWKWETVDRLLQEVGLQDTGSSFPQLVNSGSTYKLYKKIW